MALLGSARSALKGVAGKARTGASRVSRRIDQRRTGTVGAFDALAPVVKGWVKRAADDEPLLIDVFVGGRAIARDLRADSFRPDVRDAGYGTGNHGFSVPLPDGALPPGRSVIEVRLARTGARLLRRSAIGARRAAPSAAPDPVTGPGRLARKVPARPDSRHYDGRIEQISPAQMRGWAASMRNPGQVFELQLRLDGMPLLKLRNDGSRSDLQAAGRTGGLGGFALPLALDAIEPGDHEVTLELPDGSVFGGVVTVAGTQAAPLLSTGVQPIAPAEVAVVVPVYNAAEDLAVCIERLALYTPAEVEVVFIDDASPDPAIAPLLEAALRRPGTRVLRNDGNMGFTRTVNRGLDEVGRKHAILLNSDARVTPGWLRGMVQAAASRPRVATVTAMSDRAGAFSAPAMGNDNALPPGLDEAAYARLFRHRSLRLRPVVPTGNGFCMFVNRAAVDEIGGFDAEAFPRGYGEENDFCMRATRAGWTNIVDDATYVFHDRSKSFGEAKHGLMAAGRAVVDARFPEYGRAIRVFSAGMPMALARMRGAVAMADAADRRAGLPPVLFVIATQSGGTPQTNLDLMLALQDEVDGWLLRCDSQQLTLSRLRHGVLEVVRTHGLHEPVDPVTHASAEYDAVVARWLAEIAPEIVHIRHLGWHSLSLPALARAQGARVVMSFHDFYTLCPTVKLLDENAVYCGGRCTATPGDCRAELWPAEALPPLKHSWVHVWRDRFDHVLAECDAFVTTSDSARDTLLAGLPGIDPARFHVIPHGRDFSAMQDLAAPVQTGERIRILLPGNIDTPKGRSVIADLLAHDTAGRLEIHVLGRIKDPAQIAHPHLILHGAYKRDEFTDRVAQIAPHFGGVFSIWDETYCHTLTELWSAGIPALVFDFPTVAGRVRASGGGWVLPHEDIGALHDAILAIAADPAGRARVATAVAAWQQGRGTSRTTELMASSYRELYARVLGHPGPRPLVAVVCPGDPSRSLANASTHIRVWERTINSPHRPVNFVRMRAEALLANLAEDLVDGVIIQRNAVPDALVDSVLGAMQSRGIRHIHDLDDDLLSVRPGKDPGDVYAGARPGLERLIRAAGLVTASTPALADRLAELHPDRRVLPNRIADRLWRGQLPQRIARAKVTALYLGTITHADDLAAIAPALATVAARHPEFAVQIIGDQDGDLPPWASRLRVPDEARNYPEFVEWLKSCAGNFDFGIAPLTDDPFNLTKFDLKLIDYGALGLPVLASDMPVYRDLGGTQPGVTLVGPQGWEEALTAAIATARAGGIDHAAIRSRTMAEFGLEATLHDYDALVAAHVRAGGEGGGPDAALPTPPRPRALPHGAPAQAATDLSRPRPGFPAPTTPAAPGVPKNGLARKALGSMRQSYAVFSAGRRRDHARPQPLTDPAGRMIGCITRQMAFNKVIRIEGWADADMVTVIDAAGNRLGRAVPTNRAVQQGGTFALSIPEAPGLTIEVDRGGASLRQALWRPGPVALALDKARTAAAYVGTVLTAAPDVARWLTRRDPASRRRLIALMRGSDEAAQYGLITEVRRRD